jgi:PKD repeat protein
MSRPRWFHVLLALAVIPVTTMGIAAPATAALPSKPTLKQDRVIRTSPFSGSSTSVNDVEDLAYVPRDNSVWLGDDDGRAIYEVNATTGALKRTITGSTFGAVRRLNGTEQAPRERYADIESLAYDTVNDRLYVFSGACCTPAILPTAYRMTRTGGRLQLESWQPLPMGADYTAAGWNPADRRVYVGGGSQLRTYDYASNTSGSPFALSGVKNLLGIDFTDDGKDLFVAHSTTHVTRFSWPSRSPVSGWDLNVGPLGVREGRGVQVIDEKLWVPDGFDQLPNDPLRNLVYVISVGATGSTPAPPPPPPPPPPPTASFTASPPSGGAPLTVTFTDTSTGATAWHWDLGDGTTSADRTVTHTFAAPGSYTVQLTASNDGGFTTATSTVVVSVPQPPPPPPPTTGRQLVGNAGFEQGLDGWRSGQHSRLTRVKGGHTGEWAARVASRGKQHKVALDDSPGWVQATSAGTYHASGWVRSEHDGAKVTLKLVERGKGERIGSAHKVRRLSGGWHRLRVSYETKSPGSLLDLSVVARGAKKKSIWFEADDVQLRLR